MGEGVKTAVNISSQLKAYLLVNGITMVMQPSLQS